MPDLTNEEYDALDEYWTTHTPKVFGDGKNVLRPCNEFCVNESTHNGTLSP
jgi:hypothetical protein